MTAFDAGARDFVQRIASPALTYAMRGFSLLGEPFMMVLIAVVCVIVFLVARRKHAALVLGIVMLGDVVLERSIKDMVHRSRPEPFFGLAKPHSFSFPSGHALASCCLFGTMAVLLLAREQRRGVRIAIWIGAAFMIAAIAFSRVYLGVHYATDVIGGIVIGLIWILVATGIARRYARHL